MPLILFTRRIYEPPSADGGKRLLVDRLWPRGVKRSAAHIDGWLKEVAPSNELRRWFGHDPERWGEFRRRYFVELEGNRKHWAVVLELAQREPITLLYAAKDQAHNNAVALRAFLEKQAAGSRDRGE